MVSGLWAYHATSFALESKFEMGDNDELSTNKYYWIAGGAQKVTTHRIRQIKLSPMGSRFF